jgi:hypothetical protein
VFGRCPTNIIHAFVVAPQAFAMSLVDIFSGSFSIRSSNVLSLILGALNARKAVVKARELGIGE